MSMPMTAQVVKLSYGVNYVDIDGDGTPDIITRSYLDNSNNNNADFYQVMVRRPVKSGGPTTANGTSFLSSPARNVMSHSPAR